MGGLVLLKRISSALRAFRGAAGWADKWYETWPGAKTLAGTRINEDSALTISGLFAALNFLASTMATLPKVILRRLPGGGNEHAFDHPLYDRLHNKPNDFGLTSWQWIYASIIHKYLWGNWYTYLDSRSFQNRQFLPLLPERMVKYDDRAGVYIYRLPNGVLINIPKEKMLHIPHISMDGINGKGIVHYARESLGLTKAQDEFAATFFGSGIHPGGFVEVEHSPDEETRKGLQKDFNEKYSGLGKAWKFIFVTGGATVKETEIDASKAQALESRQFSVVEIARWMNLPPHILRDLARATFSNIEQQSLELVVYSLLPLATQIEQAMNIALFDDVERRTYYVKFELKGLLRGDLQARTAFYTAMLDRGVFDADQVLDLEDMNPQPDGLGKILLVPLNMVDKKTITSPPQLKIESESVAKRAVEKRSAALRRRLTIAYKPKFEQFAKRLVKKEVSAVRAAVKKMLDEHTAADFSLWLDDFYQDFPKETHKLAAPLISSYATAILPIAQEEAGSEAEINLEYTDFQQKYGETFARRHTISSKAQLQSVIRGAEAEGISEIEALEQRLDEWEERRPGKIVMRETVQMENAFTRSAFAACGIAKIMSVAYGKSCPYCQELDGRVIGIEENFLTPGDFQPEGAEKPLTVTSNHKHPPYHGGCDCGITTG